MTEKKKFIPVSKPRLAGNEQKYLSECVETGWISSEGPFISKFENSMAELTQRRFGVSVCNGTAAIDAAISALDIGAGDEVILPSFTIISCILQVVRCGATPVLVDSDPNTWNMSPEEVKEKISIRTKLILIVHIYGLPVDLDPIIQIAKEKNIYIIEDAAEMHGQKYKGIPCGSFGVMSTFSFYSNKHITTGEGGMVMTNDENLYQKLKSIRNLCFDPGRRFVHQKLGWNLRMTNLQAAVGLAQIEQLPFMIDLKRKVAELYNEALNDVQGIQLPLKKTDYAENNYWVYGILLSEDRRHSAQDIMIELNNYGIGTRPFFCPMHLQPILTQMGYFKDQRFVVSEKLYKFGFYIPCYAGLTENEVSYIVDSIKRAIK